MSRERIPRPTETDSVAEEGRELDAGAKRVLAHRLLRKLDRHGFIYAVLRDPTRLLEEGLGDLDLWVPRKSMANAMSLIRAEAIDQGWREAKRVVRPYVRSSYFVDESDVTTALAVDVFPEIRWYLGTLVSDRQLMAGRVRRDGYWALRPDLAASCAVLHYIAWSAEVPERYKTALQRTATSSPGSLAARLQIDLSGHSDLAAFRRRLLARAVAEECGLTPWRALKELIGTAASLLSSARGRWVSLDGDDAPEWLEDIQTRLSNAHYLVGPHGSVGTSPPRGWRRWVWAFRRVILARELGALILSAGPPGPFLPDVHVQIQGQQWDMKDTMDNRVAQGSGVGELDDALRGFLSDNPPATTRDSQHQGSIVGLAGPDGAGKSTLVEGVDRLMPGRLEKYHWRPEVLPRPRGSHGRAHEGPPSTHTYPPLISAARFAYYWLDTQLGFLTTWRWQKSRGRVVVVERTFLDVAIQPERYGFSLPRRVIRLGVRCSFKPDVLILLQLSGAEAVRRKAELSEDQANEQVQAWLDLSWPLVDTRCLDAHASAEALSEQATEIIDSLGRLGGNRWGPARR